MFSPRTDPKDPKVGTIDIDGFVDVKMIKPIIDNTNTKEGPYIFPDDISRLISTYVPRYKLRPWVTQINLRTLAENPSEGTLELFNRILREIPKNRLRYNGTYYADFLALNRNPEILRYYIENYKPNIELLQSNTTEFAREYVRSKGYKPKSIDREELSAMPDSLDTLLRPINQDKIDYRGLSRNPDPRAVRFLTDRPNQIFWKELSSNPSAMSVIEQELKRNPSRVNWKSLSKNPSAIKILEENRNKIDWYELSKNPSIFESSNRDVFELLRGLNRSLA